MQASKHQQIREILEKAPKAGVYVGETYDDWRSFFKFFMNFLSSELGPRGDVIKKCRALLNKDKATADSLLKILNLDCNSSVRDIYVRHRDYSPSKLYHQYVVLNDKLKQQMEVNAVLIQDSNSLMYKNIEKGLIGKLGPDYDTVTRMKEIQADYKERHSRMRETVHMMLSELEQDPKYVMYIELSQYIRPITVEWEKVDKETGNGSVERGRLFEQKCEKQGLKILFEKLGRDNFHVYKNCNWQNRNLGEIDLALAEEIEGKLTVTVLIECKSRLFDVPYAYKQIGPERLKVNKINLNTKQGLLPVSDKAQIIIMTLIPERQYVLPFESKLKAQLQRVTKNFTLSEIKEDQLYKQVSLKMAGEESPLDWWNKHSDLVIVLE